MSTRTLWLIAYDIRCPTRLRLVLDLVKVWSSGGQRSVHECWLTRAELAGLRTALAAIIRRREDSVLLVAPDPSRGVRTLGIAVKPRDARFLFVG